MHHLLFTYQKALGNGYLVKYADVLVYYRTYAKIAKKLNLSNRQDEAVRWAALPT
ncbi:MAG: hypothetical protein V7K18_06510 [Nostoc sp.]|uniref:hypothetical protein n=1 Tax=Nostoc sp. TaxID=1180 RepID=UPI002FFA48D5